MKRKTGAQKLRELVEAVPEEGMPMAEAMRRTGLRAASIETYMYHNLKLPLRLEAGRLYPIAAEDVPTTTSEGPLGPCAEERAIGERLGLEWTEEIHGDRHWWADPANGAARVWFVNGAWTQRDGGSFPSSLEAMRAYEATCRLPVSGAEEGPGPDWAEFLRTGVDHGAGIVEVGGGCGDAMRGFEAACLRLSNAVSGAEDRAQVAALGAGTIEGIDRFGEPDGARVACERCGGGAWARTDDQPAPSGGVGDVWAEIIALLPEGSRARALAVERRQVGIDRYGVPLGRGDGRDEERDEREELLDAAAFRQRRIGHPGKLARGVAELLATAVDSDVWWDAYYEWTARSTWTDREADAWRAVMRAVDPTVGAVIAALSGVTP